MAPVFEFDTIFGNLTEDPNVFQTNTHTTHYINNTLYSKHLIYRNIWLIIKIIYSSYNSIKNINKSPLFFWIFVSHSFLNIVWGEILNT